MNMAARLGRYFGNTTYLELAERSYDVMKDLKYISAKYEVFDGAYLPDCLDVSVYRFSYNAAILLQSCAYMYNAVSLSLLAPSNHEVLWIRFYRPRNSDSSLTCKLS